jgi:hypothetical protein
MVVHLAILVMVLVLPAQDHGDHLQELLADAKSVMAQEWINTVAVSVIAVFVLVALGYKLVAIN